MLVVDPAGEADPDLLPLLYRLKSLILVPGETEALALDAAVDFEATAGKGVSGPAAPGPPGMAPCGRLDSLDVLENTPCIGVHCQKVNKTHVIYFGFNRFSIF